MPATARHFVRAVFCRMKTASPSLVRCRPHPSQWVLVVLSLAFAAAWPYLAVSGRRQPGPPPPAQDPGLLLAVGLMTALFAGIALAFAGHTLLAGVSATEAGIAWRERWGARRFAPWPDVTDFYDELFAGQNGRLTLRMVLETSAGQVRIPGRDWTGRAALRTFVAERATNATRANGEWAIRGTRPGDNWPRVFGYDTPANRRLPLTLAGVVGLWAAAMLYLVGSKAGRIIAEMGWGWGLALLATMTLVFGSPVLLSVFLAPPVIRDARRRKKQQIVVNPDGLLFRDGRAEAPSLVITWDQVTRYYLAARNPSQGAFVPRYVVETGTGEAFDFSAQISDARLLAEIVRRYAKAAETHEWRSLVDEDVLDDPRDATAGPGQLSTGTRVYHYRTRTHRALLWFPLSFASIFLAQIALERAGLSKPLPHHAGDPPRIVLGISLMAATLWCWWRYRAAAICTDEDGMTQFTWFGSVHLAWSDIADFYRRGDDIFLLHVVGANGRRIRFWTSIARLDELKQEIARRAINSRTRVWRRPDKTGDEPLPVPLSRWD